MSTSESIDLALNRLHAGEPVQLKIMPEISTEEIREMHNYFQALYTETFGEHLGIIHIQTHGDIVEMTYAKKEAAPAVEE